MERRPRLTRFAAFVGAVAILTTLAPSDTAGAAPGLRARVVQSGLVHPWDVGFTNGGRMLVTERPGRIRVYADGSPGAALLGTGRVPRVRAEGEAGLMGIAVHPRFARTRHIFVCASRNYDGQWLNQLIRYRVTGGWQLENGKILIKSGVPANRIHNGCAVEVGPDGKLWVSMGDTGNPHAAQNPTNKLGKILRLNLDGTVPSDNPVMPGMTRRTRVFSMGHRNPQGIAFEPGTNRVYAIEHGPDRADEINWIRKAPDNVGRNYGWPCVTGFGDPYLACPPGGSFTNPAWSSGSSTIATSGGAFVKGTRWEDYRGNLFVSQLKEQDLRRFTVSSTGRRVTHRATLFNGTWGRLRAAVLGPNNNLWLTTSNGSNDRVIRITAR